MPENVIMNDIEYQPGRFAGLHDSYPQVWEAVRDPRARGADENSLKTGTSGRHGLRHRCRTALERFGRRNAEGRARPDQADGGASGETGHGVERLPKDGRWPARSQFVDFRLGSRVRETGMATAARSQEPGDRRPGGLLHRRQAELSALSNPPRAARRGFPIECAGPAGN